MYTGRILPSEGGRNQPDTLIIRTRKPGKENKRLPGKVEPRDMCKYCAYLTNDQYMDLAHSNSRIASHISSVLVHLLSTMLHYIPYTKVCRDYTK